MQSALGCSIPLALGVPRALSPSSPCSLTEWGGYSGRLGRWPLFKGMSRKEERLSFGWGYLYRGIPPSPHPSPGSLQDSRLPVPPCGAFTPSVEPVCGLLRVSEGSRVLGSLME